MLKVQVDKVNFNSPVNTKFITGKVFHDGRQKEIIFKLGEEKEDSFYYNDDVNTEFKYFENCKIKTHDNQFRYTSLRIFA